MERRHYLQQSVLIAIARKKKRISFLHNPSNTKLMKKLVFIAIPCLLFLTACDHHEDAKAVNENAALPKSLRFDTLGLQVMASFIDKRAGTQSILYANAPALSSSIGGDKKYKAGERMALVTWKAAPDDHWLGARIPGRLLSVEMVKTVAGTSGISIEYNRYLANGEAALVSQSAPSTKQRIDFMLEQQPSVLP